jgi:pseudouridine-5'-phosphate glycosidase/pseudouridine kinase
MPAISGDVRADQSIPKAELKPNLTTEGPTEILDKVDVLVAGSLAVDLSCDYAPPAGEQNIRPVSDTSNPATVTQSLGGVGHNVAIATKYLGSSVLFCSVVGDDLSGRAALSALQKEGLSTTGVQVLPASNDARTAQYVAVNDGKKDLVMAMADMGIMEMPEQKLDFEGFWEPMLSRTKPEWVIVDANWSPEVLSKWVAAAKKHGARVAFEPVSNAKSRRLFSKSTEANAAISPTAAVPNNAISLATPNKYELTTMYTAARESGLLDSESWWRIIDAMGMSSTGSRDRLVAMTSNPLVDQGIPQQSIQLLPFIPCIITKLGSQGVLVTQLLRPRDPRLTSPDSAPYILSRAAASDQYIGGAYLRLFPPAAVLADEEIVSVNGAGDTLLGAVISGLVQGSKTVEDVIPLAQEASLRTLKSSGGVSSDIVSLRRS